MCLFSENQIWSNFLFVIACSVHSQYPSSTLMHSVFLFFPELSQFWKIIMTKSIQLLYPKVKMWDMTSSLRCKTRRFKKKLTNLNVYSFYFYVFVLYFVFFCSSCFDHIIEVTILFFLQPFCLSYLFRGVFVHLDIQT